MTLKILRTEKRNGVLDTIVFNLKGAEFKMHREFTRTGEPSKVFHFANDIAPIDGDYSKGVIELGWDVSSSDFQPLEEMFGIKVRFKSIFARNGAKTGIQEIIQ